MKSKKFSSKAVPGFIKSVQGLIQALGLNRSEEELLKDYGMLGVHNIRAVKQSLLAIKKEVISV